MADLNGPASNCTLRKSNASTLETFVAALPTPESIENATSIVRARHEMNFRMTISKHIRQCYRFGFESSAFNRSRKISWMNAAPDTIWPFISGCHDSKCHDLMNPHNRQR